MLHDALNMPSKMKGKQQVTFNDNLVSQGFCQLGTIVLQNKQPLQEEVRLLSVGRRFVTTSIQIYSNMYKHYFLDHALPLMLLHNAYHTGV